MERENVAEKGQLSNPQKKRWEMMVIPDVDGFTKTLSDCKILWETQQDDVLKTEIKSVWARFLH